MKRLNKTESLIFVLLCVLDCQGPVVQSIVSLTSSLVVKMSTVLVSTISKLQVFLLKKCEYSHFSSKNISIYAIFNDQSFNNMLTNDIVSFNNWALIFIH